MHLRQIIDEKDLLEAKSTRVNSLEGGEIEERFVDRRELEAREGIEPSIKVLQTFALPLGDRAVSETIIVAFPASTLPGNISTGMSHFFCAGTAHRIK